MACGHLELDSAEEQVVRTLMKWQVRFVVIGGHAVRFHGHDRLVNDLDLVIQPVEDNARRLINALAELGIGGAGMTVAGLTQLKKKARLPRYDVETS
jgi:hypothetical protein